MIWPAIASTLLAVAAAAPREPSGEPPSGIERRLWDLREHFLPEGRPDPLHQNYERLFGRPYPAPGFFAPFRPFADVRNYESAFARRRAGVDYEVERLEEALRVTIWVPDEAAECVDVELRETELLLRCPRDPERSSSPHRFREPFFASVPVPEGAGRGAARIEREGRRVRVWLPRRG